jgi:hypothetical protein
MSKSAAHAPTPLAVVAAMELVEVEWDVVVVVQTTDLPARAAVDSRKMLAVVAAMLLVEAEVEGTLRRRAVVKLKRHNPVRFLTAFWYPFLNLLDYCTKLNSPVSPPFPSAQPFI